MIDQKPKCIERKWWFFKWAFWFWRYL